MPPSSAVRLSSHRRVARLIRTISSSPARTPAQFESREDEPDAPVQAFPAMLDAACAQRLLRLNRNLSHGCHRFELDGAPSQQAVRRRRWWWACDPPRVAGGWSRQDLPRPLRAQQARFAQVTGPARRRGSRAVSGPAPPPPAVAILRRRASGSGCPSAPPALLGRPTARQGTDMRRIGAGHQPGARRAAPALWAQVGLLVLSSCPRWMSSNSAFRAPLHAVGQLAQPPSMPTATVAVAEWQPDRVGAAASRRDDPGRRPRVAAGLRVRVGVGTGGERMGERVGAGLAALASASSPHCSNRRRATRS